MVCNATPRDPNEDEAVLIMDGWMAHGGEQYLCALAYEVDNGCIPPQGFSSHRQHAHTNTDSVPVGGRAPVNDSFQPPFCSYAGLTTTTRCHLTKRALSVFHGCPPRGVKTDTVGEISIYHFLLTGRGYETVSM